LQQNRVGSAAHRRLLKLVRPSTSALPLLVLPSRCHALATRCWFAAPC
jgi:hypothetical protein